MKEKVGLRRARLLLKSTWQVSGGMVQISSVVRASVVFPWGVGGDNVNCRYIEGLRSLHFKTALITRLLKIYTTKYMNTGGSGDSVNC